MIWDALVIGGGFYGTAIATYLKTRGLARVLLVERTAELLTCASANNQARIHNGYHYPRSLTTAFRSHANFPRFVADYPIAVCRTFTKLYAIARRNSHVTARNFERFCAEIGAPLELAPPHLRRLFEPRLVEEVFLVEEYAFDVNALRRTAHNALRHAGIDVRLNSRVNSLRTASGGISVEVVPQDGLSHTFISRTVFNCTYSGLNQLTGSFPRTRTNLKHEIAELALVEMPPELAHLGVTMMDGAFFSTMPFPARGPLHSLSHVRYTPHESWLDAPALDPYARLNTSERRTRVDRMVRDACRYMPLLGGVRYVDSIFEVKTVLVKNEADDGRPILFERHSELPGCYSILGGKLDNIYDVLEKLEAEPLCPVNDSQSTEGGS
jgi:glycine/D-amino acid oxidase-like deaminating enzyme